MASVLKKLGIGLLAFLGIVAFAWAMFYPAVPHSLKGWAALVFLGIPVLMIVGLAALWLKTQTGEPTSSWRDAALLLIVAICVELAIIFGAVPFTHLLELIKS